MTAAPEPTTQPSARQAAEELASGVAEQRVRVDALAGAPPDEVDLATVLGEIDIAHEEIRVAEEELRAQQGRLDRLLAERSDPRVWRRGLIGTLPVPALVSDAQGTVLEINAAASALLGRRRDQIVDRPLADLVGSAGLARLEAVLREVVSSPGTRQVRLPLAAVNRRNGGSSGNPGSGGADEVDLVVGADDPGDGSPRMLTWVAGDRRLAEDPGTTLRTAQAFAEMCRLPLTSGADPRAVLARAALLVEQAIPTCDGVSITLGPPAEPEVQATDTRFAQEVDGAQLQAGEGPCLLAYETGRTVICDDLGHDERFARLAPLALPLGVMAVLGCPIRSDRYSLGVLNVYARRTDAFDDRDRAVANLLVSAVLAVVLETRDRRELTQLSEQLREALQTRAVIDQAKGILMSRNRLRPEEAFARLVDDSRRSNTKVRDVARQVVERAAQQGADEPGAGAEDGSGVPIAR